MTVKCCVCGKNFTCTHEKACNRFDRNVCWCHPHLPKDGKGRVCTNVEYNLKHAIEVVQFT